MLIYYCDFASVEVVTKNYLLTYLCAVVDNVTGWGLALASGLWTVTLRGPLWEGGFTYRLELIN